MPLNCSANLRTGPDDISTYSTEESYCRHYALIELQFEKKNCTAVHALAYVLLTTLFGAEVVLFMKIAKRK